MKPQTFGYTTAALLILVPFGSAWAARSSEALEQLTGDSAAAGFAALPAASLYAPAAPETPAEEDPGYAKSTSSRGLSVNVAAFLDVIAYSELKGCEQFRNGSSKGYNLALGCKVIRDLSSHPNDVGKAGRFRSTAAGRYQFLYKTWKKLGMRDFSPESQDKAAVKLIENCNAGELVANASNYNSFARAIKKLSPIWASFPGSPHGQRGKGAPTMKELWSQFQQSRAKYQ